MSRRPLLPVALGGVAVLAAALLVALLGGGGDGDAAEAVEPLHTVEATRKDLAEHTELAGSLGFEDTDPVVAPAAGTVTAVPSEGDELSRGAAIAAVDARPIVLLYGSDPLYRVLEEDLEGPDVLVLEQNLASLGYHTTADDDGVAADTGFTVDGVFDDATTDAVIRWQQAVGLPDTGSVDPGDVMVAPGPVVVTSAQVEVGDRVQAGVPLVELGLGPVVEGRYADPDTDVALVAAPGAAVAAASVVWTDGGLPVIAVVADPDRGVAFDRDLGPGASPGEDIRAVERTLADAGHDAAGALIVDDVFDDATAAALDDLWSTVAADPAAVAPPGTLPRSRFTVVAPGTVLTVPAAPLSPTVPGTELWTTTTGGSARRITTAVPVSDQDIVAEGDQVQVELPDGTTVGGTVTEVALSSTTAPAAPDAEATLPVVVSVPEVPPSAARYLGLDVTVLVVGRLAADAVVVPVTALVATGDGSYAVEVVEDGADATSAEDPDPDDPATRFVAVEPGLFADGEVEVTGIDAGTTVVVPR